MSAAEKMLTVILHARCASCACVEEFSAESEKPDRANAQALRDMAARGWVLELGVFCPTCAQDLHRQGGNDD